MPNMQELKIQLLHVQSEAAKLQGLINSIVRPANGEPVPVQAVCAVCSKPIFSNDVVFTGGAYYHRGCYSIIENEFRGVK